jgi:hypothetical protein
MEFSVTLKSDRYIVPTDIPKIVASADWAEGIEINDPSGETLMMSGKNEEKFRKAVSNMTYGLKKQGYKIKFGTAIQIISRPARR